MLAFVTQMAIFQALDRFDRVSSIYSYSFSGAAVLWLDQALAKRNGIPGPHWRTYRAFTVTMVVLLIAMLAVIAWVPDQPHHGVVAWVLAVAGILLSAYGIAFYTTALGPRLVARRIGLQSPLYSVEFNVGAILLAIPFGLSLLLGGAGELLAPAGVRLVVFLLAGLILLAGLVAYFTKPAWATPRWMRGRSGVIEDEARQLETTIATQDYHLARAMERVLDGLGWFGWLRRKSFSRGCSQVLKLGPIFRAELENRPTLPEFQALLRERVERQIELERMVAALASVDYDRAARDRGLLADIWGRQVSKGDVRRRVRAIEKAYWSDPRG